VCRVYAAAALKIILLREIDVTAPSQFFISTLRPGTRGAMVCIKLSGGLSIKQKSL
jgi:hypothetical protein